MVTTDSSHYGIILETWNGGDKEIFYLEYKEEDLTSFDSVRKTHKLSNQKGSDQLVSANSSRVWMSQEVSNVRRVVKDWKVCQNFVKSVS